MIKRLFPHIFLYLALLPAPPLASAETANIETENTAPIKSNRENPSATRRGIELKFVTLKGMGHNMPEAVMPSIVNYMVQHLNRVDHSMLQSADTIEMSLSYNKSLE